MEQNISICPVCGHVYGHSNTERIPCGNCGKSLTAFSGFTSDDWNKLSSAQKKNTINSIRSNKSYIESPDNYEGPSTNNPPPVAEDSTPSMPSPYQNPGHSISTYAKICCFASIILDLLVAIGLQQLFGEDFILISVVVFAVLCIMSYLSYLLLAGFGTLVENSSKIVQLLNDKNDR